MIKAISSQKLVGTNGADTTERSNLAKSCSSANFNEGCSPEGLPNEAHALVFPEAHLQSKLNVKLRGTPQSTETRLLLVPQHEGRDVLFQAVLTQDVLDSRPRASLHLSESDLIRIAVRVSMTAEFTSWAGFSTPMVIESKGTSRTEDQISPDWLKKHPDMILSLSGPWEVPIQLVHSLHNGEVLYGESGRPILRRLHDKIFSLDTTTLSTDDVFWLCVTVLRDRLTFQHRPGMFVGNLHVRGERPTIMPVRLAATASDGVLLRESALGTGAGAALELAYALCEVAERASTTATSKNNDHGERGAFTSIALGLWDFAKEVTLNWESLVIDRGNALEDQQKRVSDVSSAIQSLDDQRATYRQHVVALGVTEHVEALLSRYEQERAKRLSAIEVKQNTLRQLRERLQG